MKFVSFYVDGRTRFGALVGQNVIDIGSGEGIDSFQQFARHAREHSMNLDQLADSLIRSGNNKTYEFTALDVPPSAQRPYLLPPITPEQAWATAFTYPVPAGWNKYAEERNSKRAILFFKGTASQCVGPNDYIGLRGDSSKTIPEPELALILDEEGQVLAYTIANDVTALDFTDKSPLYVSYSKTYKHSIALGPVAVTPSEIPFPRKLQVQIRIQRKGSTVASGESNTSQMIPTLEDLIHYTKEHNVLSLGTVLCTGGGVWLPFDFTLQPKDLVEIEIENIGILRNIVETV